MDRSDVTEKKCSKCRASKSLLSFSKCTTNKDGLQSWCRACKSRHFKENAAEILQKQKSYYEQNKAVISLKNRAYVIRNRDLVLKRQRDWYERNKDRLLGKASEYREQNSDAVYESKRSSYLKNKDYYLIKSRKWNSDNIDLVRERKYREIDSPVHVRKQHVRDRTDRAIIRGEVASRCGSCSHCGDFNSPTHIHHLHYDRPDSYRAVVELCTMCHGKADRERRKVEKKQHIKVKPVPQPDLFT